MFVELSCKLEDCKDYKVVLAGTFTDFCTSNVALYTYLSLSGKWKPSMKVSNFSISILSNFELSHVVFEEDFHWFTEDKDIIVCDCSPLLHLKEQCNPWLVHVPIATEDMILWRTDNGQTLWLGASSYDSLDIFSVLPIQEYKRNYVMDVDVYNRYGFAEERHN